MATKETFTEHLEKGCTDSACPVCGDDDAPLLSDTVSEQFKSANESFSKGWDRGNYGNAYESQDWEAWYSDQCADIPSNLDRSLYQAGMLLGFFSSYEISEISDDMIAEEVAALRAVYGEEP